MDPIERAARALCKYGGHPENIKFEGGKMWESYVPEVHVVIEALRTPSPEMAFAGERLLGEERCHSIDESDMRDSWIVMIDALLGSQVSR